MDMDDAQTPGAAAANRRAFLTAGSALSLGAGIGAMAMAAAPPAMAQGAPAESLLDRWARTKKARLGADLTSAPLRFKDANGKPTGMGVELVEMMMKDIGAEVEYVEMPFAQTFAALAAGQFDMIATFVSILPGRALRGTFCGFPAYYQQNIAYLKDGSKVAKLSELNSPDATIACGQGTSEEQILKQTHPKAKIQAFPQLGDAISAVGTGRVDALITATLFSDRILKTYPQVRVLPETYNVVPNTFFMPHNDFKLWSFTTAWLRYHASARTMLSLNDKWFGTDLREVHKIPTLTVGPGGEPLEVAPSSA